MAKCPACKKKIDAYETRVNEVNLLCQKHSEELNAKFKQILDQPKESI